MKITVSTFYFLLSNFLRKRGYLHMSLPGLKVSPSHFESVLSNRTVFSVCLTWTSSIFYSSFMYFLQETWSLLDALLL